MSVGIKEHCPRAGHFHGIHVVPHLVMRSNLDLFLERLPADLERA
jgi:hypothetical protein